MADGEVQPQQEWLDLGSLRMALAADVEVRIQAKPDGTVEQLTLVWNGTCLHLELRAAEQGRPLWEEVRRDLRASQFADGEPAQELTGEHGVELRTQRRTDRGRTELRHVGIDGPGWLLHGVYEGAAADPKSAGPLATCLREIQVERRDTAAPPHTPLPLRLPPQLVQ